ncbi:hypothetical protein FNV43_RR13934 [Rhamnella rubrinervis]|uniref:Uncharacterized protein n=1 Tax=Rhamnella rubrinervis TaxID=2594499 RepID=A0A8K0MF17_9ROSA|nr:hypothetical protein FNV43_RR13934 [Rhamnella rubrinervis]
MAVPPDITAADFKKELERVHLNCFPESGEIKVYGLMVKKKSCFYHLPESMPMKFAFQGVKGTWFLHVEARSLADCNRPSLPHFISMEVDDKSNPGKSNTECKGKEIGEKELQCHESPLEGPRRPLNLSKKKKIKKRVRKNCFLDRENENGIECLGEHDKTAVLTAKNVYDYGASVKIVEPIEEWASSKSVVEAPSEMSIEAKSVSSIIKRYFTYSNEESSLASPTSSEVTSQAIQSGCNCEEYLKETDDKCSTIDVDSFPQFDTKGPQTVFPLRSSTKTGQGTRFNFKRPEVGKRLVMASCNLGVSPSKQKNAVSLCRFKDGKELILNSCSLVKRLEFEMSDGSESDD